MPDFIRLDLAGQAAEADEKMASHVSMERYRALQADLQAADELVAKLHLKLERQIKNKRNWRERAERLAADGGEKRARPKQEVVAYDGEYWLLELLDLDAATAQEALDEAMEWIRENPFPQRRLQRMTYRGAGWEAVIMAMLVRPAG